MQQGLQCQYQRCGRMIHKICGTGISQDVYDVTKVFAEKRILIHIARPVHRVSTLSP